MVCGKVGSILVVVGVQLVDKEQVSHMVVWEEELLEVLPLEEELQDRKELVHMEEVDHTEEDVHMLVDDHM